MIKKHWPLILIIALSLITIWPLFVPGYFSHHDDLQVMRIYEMRKCLEDLQLPCRWVPDMGYGNGFPLFNYYPPAPYYLGAILSFGMSYILAAKALFLIPLVLGGIGMYYLGKEISDTYGGIVAGVLYLFAPYRALDSYVRGAVAESFALAVAPYLFYFALKIIRERSVNNLVFFASCLAVLLTSHNVMSLFFFPLLLIWIAYWLVSLQKFRSFKHLVLGILLGLGLSAYFILPAIAEQKLVQTETLTRFDLDFRVHFVTVSQLFEDRSWGYGASRLGPEDTISFQVGWPHWWIAASSILVMIGGLVLNRLKYLSTFSLGALLLTVFWGSVFMTHNRSAFIWESIGILRFAQFPWRFLSLSIFSIALIGSFLVKSMPNSLKVILAVLILISTVFLNWDFFKPGSHYELTDDQKLSGALWEEQQKAGILDYLPRGAVEPLEGAPNQPIIKEGKAEIADFRNRSNYWSFNLKTDDVVKVEIPVFDFPNWVVYQNGNLIEHQNGNHLHRIEFQVAKGEYQFVGKLENTPIRLIANLVTLASIIVFSLILTNERFRKIIV